MTSGASKIYFRFQIPVCPLCITWQPEQWSSCFSTQTERKISTSRHPNRPSSCLSGRNLTKPWIRVGRGPRMKLVPWSIQSANPDPSLNLSEGPTPHYLQPPHSTLQQVDFQASYVKTWSRSHDLISGQCQGHWLIVHQSPGPDSWLQAGVIHSFIWSLPILSTSLHCHVNTVRIATVTKGLNSGRESLLSLLLPLCSSQHSLPSEVRQVWFWIRCPSFPSWTHHVTSLKVTCAGELENSCYLMCVAGESKMCVKGGILQMVHKPTFLFSLPFHQPQSLGSLTYIKKKEKHKAFLWTTDLPVSSLRCSE